MVYDITCDNFSDHYIDEMGSTPSWGKLKIDNSERQTKIRLGSENSKEVKGH